MPVLGLVRPRPLLRPRALVRLLVRLVAAQAILPLLILLLQNPLMVLPCTLLVRLRPLLLVLQGPLLDHLVQRALVLIGPLLNLGFLRA